MVGYAKKMPKHKCLSSSKIITPATCVQKVDEESEIACVKESPIALGKSWFEARGWQVHPFQLEAWQAYVEGRHGVVNAPTGSGKTYSLMVPALLELAAEKANASGLFILWITPIRALTKEIFIAAERMITEMDLPYTVGIRTGDTSSAEKQKQTRKWPNLLITTPESLHIMLARKQCSKDFRKLRAVVVDEWHELIGSKRGVLMELALSRLKGLRPELRIWGISATIGNMEEARDVLLGTDHQQKGVTIRSGIHKAIKVQSLLPDSIEKMPWTGHIGIHLLGQVREIIERHESTLIFTNTRGQCEIWYHKLIHEYPELSGIIAMHHGSVSKELRYWVEDALYDGRLKAVICTSSLDLGVDFRPVDAIVQVGGPKGVARFVQRAGRSGHRPGAESMIYFLPTHSLELIEAAAMRHAIREGIMESREPYFRCFDVLVQYLMTLGVGEGFVEEEIFHEVQTTFCYEAITRREWEWCLGFVSTGGPTLAQYPDFKRMEKSEGRHLVTNRRIARKHRMSIGTIVADINLAVKYKNGKRIGSIEESFLSRLNPGDTFWFAGRSLELVRIRETTAEVVDSKRKTARIPAWSGGRLSFSSKMSQVLRTKLTEIMEGRVRDVELIKLQPLIELQQKRSHLPSEDQLMIEQFETEEGHHALFYPFEGRLVHEGMASLVAYRISQEKPITFSLAYNDYGFELLSDQPLELNEPLLRKALSLERLTEDVQSGVNATEMANRKFRDIAVISGLVFTGYPGAPVRDRHLQSHSQLFFKVFEDYDPDNLLLRQAYDEVIDHQLEMSRFRACLERIEKQELVLTNPELPTPFAFPIMADRIREKLSSESVSERLAKLSLEYT